VTAPRDGDAMSAAAGVPLVLFVCGHGAAKSVLAAAAFGRLAKAAGLAIDVQAAGIDPDATIAPAVIDVLPKETRTVPPQPRRVTEGDLARASRIVTFDLEASDLPTTAHADQRWDGLPSAGQDPEAFLAAVTPRAAALVDELAKAHR
jgi:arsenate reductase (thioredoxin)